MSKTIAFDIGNSNITLGVFENSKIIFRDRIVSDVRAPVDYYRNFLEKILRQAAVDASDFKVVICSVVPAVSIVLDRLVKVLCNVSPVHVGTAMCAGLKLNVPNPDSVGADRLANAVAAGRIYSKPALVIDFGTATTFDVIGESGAFEGGIICAGQKTSMTALVSNAAKLSEVELLWPEHVMGKTTETAMQTGLVQGYMAMVDGLIERLQSERGDPGKIIATGGLGSIFAQHSKYIDLYDSDLTLIGLDIIAIGVT